MFYLRSGIEGFRGFESHPSHYFFGIYIITIVSMKIAGNESR